MGKPKKPGALTNRDREVLLMYLSWLRSELESRFPMSDEAAAIIPALRSYGEARGTYFDRINALQVLQQLKEEGRTDSARFAEAARRIWNLRRPATEAEARRVERWFEERKPLSHLLDDEALNPKKGRPLGSRDKAPRRR